MENEGVMKAIIWGFFYNYYMYLHFTFVVLQISVLESGNERGCKGTGKWDMIYRQVRDLMRNVGRC